MKRLLARRMVFLIGVLFLNVTSYAQVKDHGYQRLFIGYGIENVYTDAHKDKKMNYPESVYALVTTDGRWKRFLEARADFYDGESPEFSITLNWMFFRQISYTSSYYDDHHWERPGFLIGSYIGIGPCGVRVKSGKYETFVFNVGIKAVVLVLHFDVKMNYYFDKSHFYPSVSIGFIF